MTTEQLEKGLELRKKTEHHEKQAKDFEEKADYLERKIHPTDIFVKPIFWERLQTTETNNKLGSIDFISKSLVTFLRIEAQYHYQEAKKYERELNRL